MKITMLKINNAKWNAEYNCTFALLIFRLHKLGFYISLLGFCFALVHFGY